MEQIEKKGLNEEQDVVFSPKTSAARVLIPLLDALNWKSNSNKVMEALVDQADFMDTYGLVETMANLNFKNYRVGKIKGSEIDKRILPVLIVKGNHHMLVLSIEGDDFLIFEGDSGTYKQVNNNTIQGELYNFQYADNMSDSLKYPQDNWFRKLIYRFRKSFVSVIILTLLITLLDLLFPLFIVMIYDKILLSQNLKPLIMTFVGVIICIISSYSLKSIRNSVIRYISTRMGSIISQETFTRLVYLSPAYTETASINSQIARIKDFENLKKFVTNGNLIDLFDLVFSVIYIVAIFIIGGWIGIIPIITLIVLILIGFVMKPFHKIKMGKVSEATSQRQQSLIEILNNIEEIKISGAKENWIERAKKFTGDSIMNNYDLSNYVNMTNSVSYFITNATALIIVYGGVLQVFAGRMSTGALMGVLMLYWKTASSIRSVFSLSVQINGVVKSVDQIDRFMKLPQDSSLKTSMVATKTIKGQVKFIDVSIRYNSTSNPALFNVSFSNLPGQILGITGHDGAGKTTILKLILNMYKPQGGRIIIDNVNIKQLEPLSLRRSISYSPEKDMILLGTLRDNFRSYNPSITDRKIMELSDQTGLTDYFKIFGYDLNTKLDDQLINEMSLSFKKLFNLTRMLSRDVKLYLVDEPENHLDSQTLGRIIEVLKKLAKEQDASVIISTKDEQILKNCDNVINLNQGSLSKKF